MSRRQLKTDDEAGFLRAFRDEILDLAADYHMVVRFTLRLPAHSHGLVIYGEAIRNSGTSDETVYATAEQPYPSHTANRLHAALYRAAIKLGGAIRERERLERSGDGLAP